MAKSSKPKEENAPETTGAETTENQAAERTQESTPAPEKEKEPEQIAPKGKHLVSGAEQHDFEETPVFVGAYTGRKWVREKDGKEADQKKGDVMGYYFGSRTNEEVIIPNSFAIKKAIDQINEGDVLYIKWKGKDIIGGGRTANRYDVILLDEPAERKKFGF